MTMRSTEVKVMRSARRADTYVYLPVDANFEDLPEGLRRVFGEATEFLQFTLDETRRLAQAEAPDVLKALHEQGFYLQLPPGDSHPVDQ